MALGLSISGAVFVNSAENKLSQLLPNIPRAQVQQLISGTSSSLLATLDAVTRERALESIVSAWQNM
jgi:BMFP domain-containing protein YqiC